MAAEQTPDLSQLSEDERRQVLLVLQKAKASSTSVVLIRKRKQFNRRIEFVCELEIHSIPTKELHILIQVQLSGETESDIGCMKRP